MDKFSTIVFSVLVLSHISMNDILKYISQYIAIKRYGLVNCLVAQG